MSCMDQRLESSERAAAIRMANFSLNFFTQFGLVVTNTYFNQPDCNYYTWKHPRSKKFHLLEYVITRNEHKSEVLNTKLY
jgi:hypothetical protein